MKDKRRKKHRDMTTSEDAAQIAEKNSKMHMFLMLVAWSVFLGSIYMVCIQLQFEYVLPIYLVLGSVFFLLFMILNGGVGKFNPKLVEKPDDMGYDDFDELIGKKLSNVRKAKYMLLIGIPFYLIMLLDLTILIWEERL